MLRVSCSVLPRLHLKATETRKEKLRATSYLQNFSSYHDCGLHSKCLLLVASCDQSRNSSLHLLAQFFSPNLICSHGCFCFIYVWWWSESCWLPFQNLVSSSVAFRISMMLLYHHSSGSGRLVLCCNAKKPWVLTLPKKSVKTMLSGEYSHSVHSNCNGTIWC